MKLKNLSRMYNIYIILIWLIVLALFLRYRTISYTNRFNRKLGFLFYFPFIFEKIEKSHNYVNDNSR